jgi:molecular chaperone DnaK
LNVSAKDKATGKQQSIRIQASSGLSEAEIQQMVKDAEAHAAEDKKFHELVNARNQADNLIHATEKSVKELGEKVQDGEKKEIESAIEALRAAVKEDDKGVIEAKTQKLAELSGKIAERAYAQANEQQAGAAGGEGAQASAGAKADDGTVVDADFEEVKDDK